MYQTKTLNEREGSLGGLYLSLLNVRENNFCITQFDMDEIKEMVDHVRTV